MVVSRSKDRLTVAAMLLRAASSRLRRSNSSVRWRTRASSSLSQRSCCSRDSFSRTRIVSKLRASVPTSSSRVTEIGLSSAPAAILSEASVSLRIGLTTLRAWNHATSEATTTAPTPKMRVVRCRSWGTARA